MLCIAYKNAEKTYGIQVYDASGDLLANIDPPGGLTSSAPLQLVTEVIQDVMGEPTRRVIQGWVPADHLREYCGEDDDAIVVLKE